MGFGPADGWGSSASCAAVREGPTALIVYPRRSKIVSVGLRRGGTGKWDGGVKATNSCFCRACEAFAPPPAATSSIRGAQSRRRDHLATAGSIRRLPAPWKRTTCRASSAISPWFSRVRPVLPRTPLHNRRWPGRNTRPPTRRAPRRRGRKKVRRLPDWKPCVRNMLSKTAAPTEGTLIICARRWCKSPDREHAYYQIVSTLTKCPSDRSLRQLTAWCYGYMT